MDSYERIIIRILKEVGLKGMPLRRIALNVFNITNTLFEPKNLQDVYDTVGNILRTKSQQSGSFIERAETRGWYRLNFKSQQVQQLLIEFQADDKASDFI